MWSATCATPYHTCIPLLGSTLCLHLPQLVPFIYAVSPLAKHLVKGLAVQDYILPGLSRSIVYDQWRSLVDAIACVSNEVHADMTRFT